MGKESWYGDVQREIMEVWRARVLVNAVMALKNIVVYMLSSIC